MSKNELKLLHSLQGHSGALYALRHSGDLVFSGGADGILGAWNRNTFEPAPLSVRVGKTIFSLYTDEERFLIGQSEGGIHVVNRAEKREIRHLKFHEKGVFDLLNDSENGHFYSTGGDGILSVFSSEDYRLQLSLKLSDQKLRRLSISPDGKFLTVSGSDGKIWILETGYFNEIASVEAHSGGAYGLLWLDNLHLLTTGRDGHIRFWKWMGLELVEEQAVPAHNFAIYDITDLGDGNFATASRDKTVKIWDTQDLSKPLRLIDPKAGGHLRSVNVVLAVGDQVWSAGDDGVIRVWG